METKETFAKLQQIEALLAAYRNGWISYDSAHVKQLQQERNKLKDSK